MAVRSCWILAGTGTRCRIRRSRPSQACSMGNMSGKYAGHARTGIFSASRNCIDPFNVCKHRKPRLGARAAWGQKNGAANRPAYCVKEKQTSLIDR